MAVTKKLEQIRKILKPKLSKVGEIKTYEVIYECYKAGLEVNYKTATVALRTIMEEMVFAGNAYKVRMGCWMINKPANEVPTWEVVHPSDDKRLHQIETIKKCEQVKNDLGKAPELWKVAEVCTNNGVSVQTYIQYLKERKMKRENNSTI